MTSVLGACIIAGIEHFCLCYVILFDVRYRGKVRVNV